MIKAKQIGALLISGLIYTADLISVEVGWLTVAERKTVDLCLMQQCGKCSRGFSTSTLCVLMYLLQKRGDICIPHTVCKCKEIP